MKIRLSTLNSVYQNQAFEKNKQHLLSYQQPILVNPWIAVSKHGVVIPGLVESSPTGLCKAPAFPLGYLSGCSTLSG